MKLPSIEKCSHDQFLHLLRSEDERGFFSKKTRSNQSFIIKGRFLFCFNLMKKYMTPPSASVAVADFACGTGNVGLMFAEEGYNVDFIDNEVKFFDFIKLKHEKGNIDFHKGDCSSFVSDKKYSAIFFGEAIEHMADPLKTLKNLRENLVTGGLLCLTTPNDDFVNCYVPNGMKLKISMSEMRSSPIISPIMSVNLPLRNWQSF